MKLHTVTMCPVLVLLGALGYGCAADVEDGNTSAIEPSVAAMEGDDAIHPGCGDFLAECRDGKPKMCEKYSERCEVRIGVIGDSLSDEYQGAVSALPGLTWTEQVQAGARISLGANEDDPSVRGEPRNDGYALNWARFGQAALGLQWSSQAVRDHPNVPASQKNDPRLQTIGQFDAQIHGLGAQIAAGEIDVALVWVGHNDLFIRNFIGFELDGGQQAFFGSLIGRIVTAAATLRAYASADPEDVQAKVAIVGLAGAASALNPALSQAAAGAGIPFIDSFNTAVSAIVNEQATTGTYDVAGTALLPFTTATNGIGCATPAYAEPFRHYDGVHPNTLYMGVVGNQIVTDVNTRFGFAMQTISETGLLDTAGL
jgi:hypothetical protein